jgi:hypothetical protein
MSQIKIKQIEGLQDVLDAIIVSITSGSVKSTFTEIAHGFSAGQIVAFDGGNWIIADASTEDHLGRIVIESITDANNFIGVQLGTVEVSTWNLTPGAFYVVDDSGTGYPALFTDNDAYAFSNPVMQAITSTTAHVLPWRPSVGAAVEIEQGVQVYQRDLTPTATSGNYSATGITITYTPFLDSAVDVLVNGLGLSEADGDRDSAAVYFSNDGGVTAKTIANIEAGDELYWNAVVAGFELTVDDTIDIMYERAQGV